VRGEHIHRLDALTCPPEDPALSMEEILSFPPCNCCATAPAPPTPR
jgi:hypothetical protein